MYTTHFSYNFYQNFILSFFFLLLTVTFSSILSENLNRKKIYLFGNLNFLISFYIIFFIYSLMIIFSLILDIQEHFKYILYSLILGKITFIFFNRDLLIHFYFKAKNFNFKEKFFLLITIILALLYLIAILPLSDADSIAYHLNSILYLFENGIKNEISLYKFLEFSLLSNSELLLFFSIFFGSDNFGAQLNIVSIIIFSLFFLKEKKLFSLILLSCPLIIFFVSTQKLQMFFGLLFLLLFYLVHYKKIKSNKEIFLFIILIFFYSSGKISYILYSVPLFIYFLMINLKKIKFIFFSSLVAFCTIYFPIFYVKFILFGNPISPLLSNIFLNNSEIFEPFIYSIRSSEGWLDGKLKNVLLPFFPINISKLTSSLGLCFLLLLFNLKLQKKLNYIPALLAIIILGTGQVLSRYFIEIFLILAFFCNQKNRLILWTSFLQLFFVIIFTFVFIFKSYIELNVLKNTFNYKKNFSYTFINNQRLNKLNLQENILNFYDARPSIYSNKNVFSTRYIDVKSILNKNDYEKNLSNFINENKIKIIITNDDDKLIECIEKTKINEIYFEKKVRNFLIQNKPKKASIFLVNNTCKSH